MRKLLAGVAVVAAGLVPVAVTSGAVASTAAKAKPPVKLPGMVNNHGTAVAAGGSIELDQHDDFYSPTFVQVPKGTTALTVTVKNMGQSLHNFTVPSANVSDDINPGESMTVTVPVSRAGILFYCRFHQSLGMQGAFFTKKGVKVTSGAGSGASTATTKGGAGGYGY